MNATRKRSIDRVCKDIGVRPGGDLTINKFKFMRTQTRVFDKLVVISENVLIVSSSLRHVEGEAANVEAIAISTTGIVGRRYLVEMRSHDRVYPKPTRAKGQEVDSLNRAICARVPKDTGAGFRRENGAIIRPARTLPKRFVRVEEERFVQIGRAHV